MISRRKESILLLEECFDDIKQKMLDSRKYSHLGPTPLFDEVVSFFYKHYSRPSNMRSRPWALGNTLHLTRDHERILLSSLIPFVLLYKYIRQTNPNISSFIRHTLQIQDKSPCAVQTVTVVANTDWASLV